MEERTRTIYLDHAATTAVDPRIVEAMVPYFTEHYGNASSIYSLGREAHKAMDKARRTVADILGCRSEEIVFTSCGSESDNLALRGVSLAQREAGKGNHIITSPIEHHAVGHTCEQLEKHFGFEVTYVPIDKHGVVDPDEVRRNLRTDTILVSIMHANGEVGTIEPIQEIAQITRERKIPFHTDAVATAGTIPVNVKELGVDTLSLAGNQFYGPKGIGALWVRKGVRIMPLLDGGIQEGGRRAGTENVPAIVGLGKAADLARTDMVDRTKQLNLLRDRLLKELPSKIENVVITGHPQNRLPGHASFCVEFIEGESMLLLLNSKGVAVTSGSACTSRVLKASHVLISMGIPHELAQGSILFTLGIGNTPEDIDYVLETMPPIVDKLRQMSPLYAKFTKSGKGGK